MKNEILKITSPCRSQKITLLTSEADKRLRAKPLEKGSTVQREMDGADGKVLYKECLMIR